MCAPAISADFISASGFAICWLSMFSPPSESLYAHASKRPQGAERNLNIHGPSLRQNPFLAVLVPVADQQEHCLFQNRRNLAHVVAISAVNRDPNSVRLRKRNRPVTIGRGLDPGVQIVVHENVLARVECLENAIGIEILNADRVHWRFRKVNRIGMMSVMRPVTMIPVIRVAKNLIVEMQKREMAQRDFPCLRDKRPRRAFLALFARSLDHFEKV